MAKIIYNIEGQLLYSVLFSLKTLNNSMDCSGSRVNISVLASLSVTAWSIFSSVLPSLDAGKININVCFQCGFRYDISKPQHRRIPVRIFWVKIAPAEPLKRITGRMFRIRK